MKKILSILIIQLLFISGTYANTSISVGSSIKITTDTSETVKLSEQEVTREDVFKYYTKFINSIIPDSYKYIELQYRDIKKGTQVYDHLQMLVYYNLLENKVGKIYPEKNISALGFYTLSEKVLGFELLSLQDKKNLGTRLATKKDFAVVDNIFTRKMKVNTSKQETSVLGDKKEIFEDVYNVLSKEHYKQDDFTNEELINSAIEGLAQGTGDKHTSYFPPVESEGFLGQLQGDYEGIGAYVDMTEPGVFMIISPMNDGPAFKSGIKGGDQVIQVDDNEIEATHSSAEIISWIKGPKGTVVKLKIKRGEQILDIDVTRDRIVIKNVESEKINSRTYLITINSFGENVSGQFKTALEELKENTRVNKLIIDVRNNGGGYLDEVTEMLSYIVPEGKQTALVKSLNGNRSYTSAGYDLIDFNNYQIVILQNSGTASASEILAGTIKDYFPDTIIIGEQSYGKGSVQRTKQYSDSSILKYTIAGWYTGGTETSIDGVGITPDEVLEFDSEKYNKYEQDNQLEKAIGIN